MFAYSIRAAGFHPNTRRLIQTSLLPSSTRALRIAIPRRPGRPKPSRTTYLPEIPLPSSSSGPPPGYSWEDLETASPVIPNPCTSGMTAFKTALGLRDKGLANPCVTEKVTIPPQPNADSGREPRNALVMCPSHHDEFSQYYFFIRYMPSIHKYIFITPEFFRSERSPIEQYHSKALPLPPSLLLIHKFRVRGHNPFAPNHYRVPVDARIRWQHWVKEDWVVNVFKGANPEYEGNNEARGSGDKGEQNTTD
ncbi:hypothetical protein H2248_001588 [Termitomyces sp. 'cryptogamus']|nr:hypothetical protein H2248_001588 [Termitomyces sp. 'cryptogamus']